MKLLEKNKSFEDETIKFVFELNGQIIEFNYIDNKTGKDIICVPCQTMCNMSCKFCHLTDNIGKIPLKNLTNHEIVEGIQYVIDDLNIGIGLRPLLISYMGCGEPLANIGPVIDSMIMLDNEYDNIRFGLATMLPKANTFEMFELAKRVKDSKLNLKVHLSLHFSNDKIRKEWMPSALDIKSSISALEFYGNYTGNPIEVHYTLMDGVNDTDDDMYFLELNININTTIKFMRYSKCEALIGVEKVHKDRLEDMMSYLESTGMIVEYYEPPGQSIGASCGQFLINKYELIK
jgi:23S rRNA (adenine2503-C2)-methyltransferase